LTEEQHEKILPKKKFKIKVSFKKAVVDEDIISRNKFELPKVSSLESLSSQYSSRLPVNHARITSLSIISRKSHEEDTLVNL
jgi:hypothetical protein